jgi:8-oxo-dGTP diphosphatase
MTVTHESTVLHAAGGVLWRSEGFETHVALVHRPRYDDWTLPKGKLLPRETPLMGAVREIGEETGASVEVGRRLSTVEYFVGTTPKRVSYWAMRFLAGEHAANAETDALNWLTIAEATRRLTYPVDRGVLADFARLPADTTTLLVLRHAKAGRRSEWHDDDRLRPLDRSGRRQAKDAVRFLAAFAPKQLYAADRVRCEQSVAPLAAVLGLRVQTMPEMSDEAYLADPGAAQRRIRELFDAGSTSVVCSQGKAIPALLADLDIPATDHRISKGSVWALSTHKGVVVAADYYPRPTA